MPYDYVMNPSTLEIKEAVMPTVGTNELKSVKNTANKTMEISYTQAQGAN